MAKVIVVTSAVLVLAACSQPSLPQPQGQPSQCQYLSSDTISQAVGRSKVMAVDASVNCKYTWTDSQGHSMALNVSGKPDDGKTEYNDTVSINTAAPYKNKIEGSDSTFVYGKSRDDISGAAFHRQADQLTIVITVAEGTKLPEDSFKKLYRAFVGRA